MESSLNMEKKLTQQLLEIGKIAENHKDTSLACFLESFLEEQVSQF